MNQPNPESKLRRVVLDMYTGRLPEVVRISENPQLDIRKIRHPEGFPYAEIYTGAEKVGTFMVPRDHELSLFLEHDIDQRTKKYLQSRGAEVVPPGERDKVGFTLEEALRVAAIPVEWVDVSGHYGDFVHFQILPPDLRRKKRIHGVRENETRINRG